MKWKMKKKINHIVIVIISIVWILLVTHLILLGTNAKYNDYMLARHDYANATRHDTKEEAVKKLKTQMFAGELWLIDTDVGITLAVERDVAHWIVQTRNGKWIYLSDYDFMCYNYYRLQRPTYLEGALSFVIYPIEGEWLFTVCCWDDEMKAVAPDGTVHTQYEFDFLDYGIIVFGCSAESGDTVTVGGQKYMLTRGKWVEVN